MTTPDPTPPESSGHTPDGATSPDASPAAPYPAQAPAQPPAQPAFGAQQAGPYQPPAPYAPPFAPGAAPYPAQPGVSGGYGPPAQQPPAYPAAPSQPLQPPYGAYPYPAAASQPMPPYAPPTTPAPPDQYPYAPPSQPFSQPLSQPFSQPLYGAPPSTPFAPAPGAYPPPMTPPPTPGTFLPGVFGPPPPAPQPTTPLQRLLLRNLQPRYAVNPLITALIGTVAALVAGLALTAVAEAIWSRAVSGVFGALGSVSSYAGLGNGIQSLLTPDLLKLFLIEQHVPLTILGVTVNLPLTGLFIFPALALVFGGYIAASSDFTRQARFSVARGAFIAPFYAVALAIIAAISPGSEVAWAFFYGLLWGALCGALGGWIQLHGSRFLAFALPALHATSRPRVAGALAGAGLSYLVGLLLAIVTLIGAAAYAVIAASGAATGATGGSPSPETTISPGQAFSSLALVFLLTCTLIPAVAVWLFAFGTGASLDAYATTSATPNATTTFGLLGAQHGPPSAAYYALILIPLLAYFVGGRFAARVARAQRNDDAFIAGALIALPLSVVLTIASALAGVIITTAQFNASVNAGVAPSLGGVFLASLIVSAVVGGLGGVSASSTPSLGGLPRLLLLPFRPLGALLFPLFDLLTARPQGRPRSAAREWIYDSALAAAGMGVVVIALAIANAPLAFVLPYNALITLNGVVDGLLLGLPLLFLIGALVAAITTPDPQATFPAPGVYAPALVAVPVGAPVAGAYPAYPTYPAPPPYGGYQGAAPPPPAQPFGGYAQPAAPSTPPPPEGYAGYTPPQSPAPGSPEQPLQP